MAIMVEAYSRGIALPHSLIYRAAGPLIDHRHQMTGSLARASWALREDMSFYDGLYAALAAALTVPLLTADERLAKAPGLRCEVAGELTVTPPHLLAPTASWSCGGWGA
jgi:hypothetical protein